MEINELIEVYQTLLPEYKLAFKDNCSAKTLRSRHLGYGICNATFGHFGYNKAEIVYKLFKPDGYYKNYISNISGAYYLFRSPKTGKDLKNRIDFMESEIKSLKRLQKRGYTHV